MELPVAEDFFSPLKTEMYHHYDFKNHLSARTAVMEYIKGQVTTGAARIVIIRGCHRRML